MMLTMNKIFLDSNVLIYLYTADEINKINHVKMNVLVKIISAFYKVCAAHASIVYNLLLHHQFHQ